MNEILIYKIRTLFRGRSGESQTESRKGTFTLGEQKLNVSFDITLMKMDDAIAVFIKNFRTIIPAQCSKCLKKFDQEMAINMAEREFLFESANNENEKREPLKIDGIQGDEEDARAKRVHAMNNTRSVDIECTRRYKTKRNRRSQHSSTRFSEVTREDFFFANIKLMEINIEEMLRQEILLHFLVFPVCSDQCKGLCSVCGKSQNENACRHKNAQIPNKTEVKPFAHLKKLLL